ncbi:MAG TPA: hypothetical protein VK203_16175 [Nostocaceae cyanobacterium]|nr:hypothetical protein [Nostocaceae cyanobacterium]
MVQPTSQPKPQKAKGNIFTKLFWLLFLLSLPVGVVWIANLPYPQIRRPVAKNAPLLLAPSYIKTEQNYRQALVTLEQAEQLIEKPTSAADLNLGEEKLQQTKQSLDAIPSTFIDDWYDKYRWYDWRFSVSGYNSARQKVGFLQVKVFQEKNAQTLLTNYTQSLTQAKQQYQQAKTDIDKQNALSAWRVALNQLEQIPTDTLAGQTARAQLDADKQELEKIGGILADNERVRTLVNAAKQFAWQAAITSQKPPHTLTKWQQIEKLWEEAINRLENISPNDGAGYGDAQKLLATYQANLAQVKIRKQAESDSVEALAAAERDIEYLLKSLPNNPQNLNRNQVTGELRSIINNLEKVQNGTTAYPKAQELLVFAKKKLNQLEAQ